MNIKIFDGFFNSSEAESLITKVIHLKIKFHEEKLKKKDIIDREFSERRIIELHKTLFEFRKYIKNNPDGIYLNSEVIVLANKQNGNFIKNF